MKSSPSRSAAPSKARRAGLILGALALLAAGAFYFLDGTGGDEAPDLPPDARSSFTAAGGGRFYVDEQAQVAPALYASRLQVMRGDVSVRVRDEPLMLVFPGGEIRVVDGSADLKVLLQDSEEWDLIVARWGLEASDSAATALSIVSLLEGEGSIRTPAEVMKLDPNKPALVVRDAKGASRIVIP